MVQCVNLLESFISWASNFGISLSRNLINTVDGIDEQSRDAFHNIFDS